MPICPNCDSEKIVKNGRIHNGKQRFKCNECSRQFVETSEKIVISQEKRDLIVHCAKEFLAIVRKTLSFSKKIENHVGAIWYFVHHYNASLHL